MSYSNEFTVQSGQLYFVERSEMKNRVENTRYPPWTKENARKAFKDRFGLPRKEMLASPLTRVRTKIMIVLDPFSHLISYYAYQSQF